MKQVQYIILTDGRDDNLTARVNIQLSQGWQCQGGVAVAVDPFDNLIFAQAMVCVEPYQVTV